LLAVERASSSKEATMRIAMALFIVLALLIAGIPHFNN